MVPSCLFLLASDYPVWPVDNLIMHADQQVSFSFAWIVAKRTNWKQISHSLAYDQA